MIERGDDFAFESTLSGVTVVCHLCRARDAGYEVHVFYLWLPTVELSIHRVRLRVASGGHDVPEATIRRCFNRSLRNFWQTYRAMADEWRLYDASDLTVRAFVAEASAGHIAVELPDVWARVERAATTDAALEGLP